MNRTIRRAAPTAALIAAWLTGVAALGVALDACAAGSAHADTPPNTDPRTGWVDLGGGPQLTSMDQTSSGMFKRCDGPNLVYVWGGYQRGGVAVLADSRECAR